MEKSIIIAGFGGQGVLSAGIILANAFMLNNKQVTWYPCYGAEMRGGAVNCEIVVSDEAVTSVHKKESDFIITLNDLSFNKFVSRLKKGGTIIANSSMIKESYPRNDIKYIFAKISDMAREQGNVKAANMAALGILSTVCDAVNIDSLKKAIENIFTPNKIELRELNFNTLEAGCKYIERQ